MWCVLCCVHRAIFIPSVVVHWFLRSLNVFTGRKDYIRLNARDGESISISNAAIGGDTTESLKNAVGLCVGVYVHVLSHA